MSGFAIGIDVGGTFTDAAVRTPAGATVIAKAPTTPEQSDGVLDALGKAAGQLGLTLPALLGATGRLVHGTTVATNALLQGRGARVGMLVTEGHRDVIEMREGLKPERYNLRMPPPAPAVPRALRVPVRERMRPDGTAALALDEASLAAGLEVLAQAGVQAVAICFLHSWRNPAHEAAAAASARARLPDAFVTASSDVLPEIKEFERFSTAVANAAVGPVVRTYLRKLEARLEEAGLRQPLLIMLSHGGVVTVDEAIRVAAGTALSGPAGGVAAGVALARAGVGADLLTFDMGGTSTDIALIRGGQSGVASGREVGGMRIALPSLDIVTLGAGGGSIASRGPGGLLRVGPESAGADPGPACYGRGGTEPTMTDANLHLGFLPGGTSLSGRTLDPAAAEAALRRVGEALELDTVTLAAGIWRLVNARMADAVRVATVRRGVDPRRFTLLSFGGAAGLHVAAVAAELGIGRVVVPAEASVLSAWGMLHTDLRVQSARSFAGEAEPDLVAAFADMEQEGRERLAWFDGALDIVRSADIRYGEQVFEIPVSLDGIDLAAPDARDRIEASFARAHEALFTYALPGEPVVIVNARLAVTGVLPPAPEAGRVGASKPGNPQGARPIFLGALLDAPVWRLEALADTQAVDGPALIESATTTVLLRPGDRARLDGRGWLTLEVGESR